MDIKMGLAMDIADQYHCTILRDRCPDDDAPLIKFPGQNIALCPMRIVKNELAQQLRSALVAALKKEAEEASLQSEHTIGDVTVRHVGNETFIETKKSVWEPRGNLPIKTI